MRTPDPPCDGAGLDVAIIDMPAIRAFGTKPAGRARQGRGRSRSRSDETTKSGALNRMTRGTCALHPDEAQAVAASLKARLAKLWGMTALTRQQKITFGDGERPAYE